MSNGDLNWITNFIWGIADDALSTKATPADWNYKVVQLKVSGRLYESLYPAK